MWDFEKLIEDLEYEFFWQKVINADFYEEIDKIKAKVKKLEKEIKDIKNERK